MTDNRPERPADDQNAANRQRRESIDARTEADLKRLSREDGPIVAGGWVFEDGDQHPLPGDDREQGGEGA